MDTAYEVAVVKQFVRSNSSHGETNFVGSEKSILVTCASSSPSSALSTTKCLVTELKVEDASENTVQPKPPGPGAGFVSHEIMELVF